MSAPTAVAEAKISSALHAVLSKRQAFPRKDASFIATTMSRLFDEEQPSVPIPMRMPRRFISSYLKV